MLQLTSIVMIVYIVIIMKQFISSWIKISIDYENIHGSTVYIILDYDQSTSFNCKITQ
jgi:hypothetical protein